MKNCDYKNNPVSLVRVRQRTSAFSSRQFEKDSIHAGEAAIADIVDKALDLLKFRPEHFGAAKKDVPLVGFRMDFEQP